MPYDATDILLNSPEGETEISSVLAIYLPPTVYSQPAPLSALRRLGRLFTEFDENHNPAINPYPSIVDSYHGIGEAGATGPGLIWRLFVTVPTTVAPLPTPWNPLGLKVEYPALLASNIPGDPPCTLYDVDGTAHVYATTGNVAFDALEDTFEHSYPTPSTDLPNDATTHTTLLGPGGAPIMDHGAKDPNITAPDDPYSLTRRSMVISGITLPPMNAYQRSVSPSVYDEVSKKWYVSLRIGLAAMMIPTNLVDDGFYRLTQIPILGGLIRVPAEPPATDIAYYYGEQKAGTANDLTDNWQRYQRMFQIFPDITTADLTNPDYDNSFYRWNGTSYVLVTENLGDLLASSYNIPPPYAGWTEDHGGHDLPQATPNPLDAATRDAALVSGWNYLTDNNDPSVYSGNQKVRIPGGFPELYPAFYAAIDIPAPPIGRNLDTIAHPHLGWFGKAVANQNTGVLSFGRTNGPLTGLDSYRPASTIHTAPTGAVLAAPSLDLSFASPGDQILCHFQQTESDGTSNVWQVMSSDDGDTWSDPTMAFEGGTLPYIGRAMHGGTGERVATAFVPDPDADDNSGTIQATFQALGDAAPSAPLAIQMWDGSANVPMVVMGTGHSITQMQEGQVRWHLLATIAGEDDPSDWYSADEGSLADGSPMTFTRFT